MADETTETTQVTQAVIDPTVAITAKLIDKLKQSKKIHDAFTKQMKQRYSFDGKLMSDWKKEFRVAIPDGLNPRICIELNTKINDLYQQASNKKSDAEASLTSLKASYADSFRDAFNELVEEYKSKKERLPAKDTLTQLAEHKTTSLHSALVHGEMQLGFWKDILNNLSTTRKIIENNTINLSVEAKALSHEQYLNHLNKGNNGGYNG